ncbi:MAG: glycosyltransferase family 2 protein [Proteobacteria bacterium]|nr:glycosyltransferase family 2 protein [Pseudomonadota bacterium]
MSAVPYISVIVPVYNEQDNLDPLTRELMEVLAGINRPHEIIFVDDGSTDASLQKLDELRQQHACIRIIRFKKNSGQTSAFDAGFKAARGDVVITMDADLQNDPHDIAAMLPLIGQYDLVCGWRHKRNDNFVRRVSSRIANGIRNKLSGEDIQDVGCSLKVFRREYAQRLKLFTGMHRFFPTLVKFEGGRVAEVKVNHRSRKFGTPKYNIRNRIMRSFLDLLAVCWMKKRYLGYTIEEQK